MDYPDEFSGVNRTRIEAERIKARRELEAGRKEQLPAGQDSSVWDQHLFDQYVLRVFRAFAREACDLGGKGVWDLERIRAEVEDFLGSFTIIASEEYGRDRFGRILPCMTPQGYLLKPEKRYRPFQAWREFEDDLLKMAEETAEPAARHMTVDGVTNRHAEVDEFLRRCNQLVDVKIRRTHIWKSVGYTSPRQFQLWQALDPKATRQDDRKFCKILAMEPEEFIALLRSKHLLT